MEIIKIAGIALTGVISAALLKSINKDISLYVILATAVIILIAVLGEISEIFSFIENIYDKAENITTKTEYVNLTINGAETTTTGQILDNYQAEDTAYHVFGLNTDPYKFDNSSPEITIVTSDEAEKWAQEHSATVNITEVGLAGLDTSTFKYVWVDETNLTEEEKALSEVTFTSRYNSATDNGNLKNLRGTFTEATNAEIPTPKDGKTEVISGKNWYLWVLAKDKLGNTAVVKSTRLHYDNEIPKIEVTPNKSNPDENDKATPVKSQDVTITVIEKNSGLADDNMKEYYLSSNMNKLENGEWKDYTSGETIEDLGEGLTGNYYIFVRQLVDKVGNVSIQSAVEITEGEYTGTFHRYGPYLFDNSGPLVSATPQSTAPVKSQEVTITVKDQGHADLNDDTNSYEYYLSTSYIEPTGGSWVSYKEKLTEKTEAATKNNSIDIRTANLTLGTGLTGKYYLFIRRISDNLGHESEAEIIDPTSFTQENEMLDSFGNPKIALKGQIVQKGTESYHLFGIYKFDNSNPTVDLQYEGTTNANADDGKAVKTQTEFIEVKDIGLSGLDDSVNSYEYYLSTSNTKVENGEWKTYTLYREPGYENDLRSGYLPAIGQQLGEGLNGTYYLYIKAVNDKLGHQSNITGTMKTVKDANGNDVLCHMYGPYVFDNSQPEIEFESIDPENESEWAKSHTEQVTVTDVGTAGVNEDTLRFVWLKGSDNVPTEITDFTQTFENGQTISIAAGTGNEKLC